MKLKNVHFKSVVFIAAIFVLGASSLAQAQATRTWVSGLGDDVNPCSRTAPCKTFAGAISKTAVNGEINVLDPGGFGAVTITKSITIDGSGGSLAGVLVPGTNAFVVNDGGAGTAVVTLRNLNIDGVVSGLVGVQILSAKTVTIENCLIYGFQAGTARGVNDARTNSGGELYISDTIIRNNGQSAVVILPTSPVIATLARVHLLNNGNSGLAITNGNATISDSVIAGNTAHGLFSDTGAVINSENNRISGNGGIGVDANGGSTIRLSNTLVTNNVGAGFSISGATINTFSNNHFAGNGANVGALSPIAPQ
jgi:Right handed beta helix region